MKIITVTDAWEPQVNGVVRTIQATNRELESAGHETALVTPKEFVTIPCPGYSEIRLALFPYRKVARRLREELSCDVEVAIHIATEGPLGRAAARYCRRYGVPFTTAYHTRFPQYLRAMFRIPEKWTYASLRRFHGQASAVLAATATVETELRAVGFNHIERWARAVDTDLFRCVERPAISISEPVFLYVGRVSVEKNIEAFLRLDLPGTKIVGGDGPALRNLKQRFPDVVFTGVVTGEKLAQLYSTADVFVFPSRTDTFGLVMLEALACGTPVAAYPVQGPLDVVGDSGVAVLDSDLRRAALRALRIDRVHCREFALNHSWRVATQRFLELQRPVGGRRLAQAGVTASEEARTIGFAHRLPIEPLA
jgi:glycosyltransferase involved in cell wall biosynthesis